MIINNKNRVNFLFLVMGLFFISCTNENFITPYIESDNIEVEQKIPFEIIAHRGASYDEPENTLLAFRKAFELKSDAIELDIWKSLDDSIMVIHDRNTYNVTGESYEVPETSSVILRNLNLKKQQKIPFLSEVLNELPENGKIFFDIKLYNEKGRAGEFAKELVDLINKNNLKNRSYVICFSPIFLAKIKKIDPEIKCVFNTYQNNNDHIIKVLVDNDLDGLNIEYKGLNDDLVKRIREKKLLLYTWTINDPTIAINVYDIFKVDGIITKRPGIIRKKAAEYYN